MGAEEIWLVRHGESVANVIATAAQAAGAQTIDVEWRDADVPLSPTGEAQARAVGTWLAEDAASHRPAAIWSSPYLRARQTTAFALAEAGIDAEVRVDERLRDRELGILDRLTSVGVDARYPEEAERRRWQGKFYYRPPGGESWADVALRIRSFLGDLEAARGEAPGESREESPSDPRVTMIVAHDAVVMLFLYVCTGLSEEQLMEFAASHAVGNASVTRLSRPSRGGPWTAESFAADEHLDRLDVEKTKHQGETDAEVQ